MDHVQTLLEIVDSWNVLKSNAKQFHKKACFRMFRTFCPMNYFCARDAPTSAVASDPLFKHHVESSNACLFGRRELVCSHLFWCFAF